MINRDRLVERFLRYIQIDSETRYERDFALHLSDELTALGFEVEFDNAGEKIGGNCGNLIAKIKGSQDGQAVLLSGHMDTVSPGKGIKPIIKDDVIYSDGTTILGGDDKAGIAMIVEAFQTIKENNLDHKDIELLFTVAEEGGLNGSKNLDTSKISASHGFILDSSKLPGEIITSAPAQAKLDIKVKGRAAHAGVRPEDGINALQVASRAIDNMKLLRIDEETTANIGIISGGSATNVVMPELDMVAEVRSLCNEKLDNQIEHMKKCFASAAVDFDATVHIDIKHMYASFKIEDEHELVQRAVQTFESMGIEASTTSTGGGSDANILNKKGITVLNLGIGERKAHTVEEHYHISDLLTMTQFVMNIIK